MPGSPTSEHPGPDSYEVAKASLYATLHRREGLLHALDVDCHLRVTCQPAFARIDNQEAPA